MIDCPVDEDGIVKTKAAIIEDELFALEERFKSLLSPKELEAIYDNIKVLWSYLQDIDDGIQIEAGMVELINTSLKMISQGLSDLECSIELEEPSLKKLIELNKAARISDPDETIEDTLSKIIFAIPMPG